jgi:hypothetical protein
MDSLVDIVTRLWTSRSGNRGSVPDGRRDNYYLLTSQSLDRFWTPHKPHLRGGCHRGKAAGEWGWAVTCILWWNLACAVIPSYPEWCLVKHTDFFSFVCNFVGPRLLIVINVLESAHWSRYVWNTLYLPLVTSCQESYWQSFLVGFKKLRKAFISFVTSVCPSARINSAPTGLICVKFGVWVFFENLFRKFKFH